MHTVTKMTSYQKERKRKGGQREKKREKINSKTEREECNYQENQKRTHIDLRY